MSETTLIKNASWVVAWDKDRSEHVYLNDVDLVFSGNTIKYVGSDYTGPADRTLGGRGFLVLPGLVDIHSHPTSEPASKGIYEDTGTPELYNSSLYEYMPLFRLDPADVPAAVQVAYSELLLSGVTTLADLSTAHEHWLDLAAKSGLRIHLAPGFRSARWYTKNGHSVEYEWDEPAGRAAMEGALKLIEAARKHPCGRLSGLIIPAQIDTCTAELIQAGFAAAEERNLPFQIHAAQSIVEVQEIARRHGLSSIQWLDKLGVLSPRTIIGHGIYLDHHPWTVWTTRTDKKRLAQTGCSVAHCPTVFARHGMKLEHFAGYVEEGINVGLGTDTAPHNMLEEIRTAIVVSRLHIGNHVTTPTSLGFNAATLGGARALLREDIGRLSPGAKADLVLVDLEHPMMKPNRDPIRSLVYHAAERAVRHVFVDGLQVVRDGQVLTMDYPAAAEAVNQAQARFLAKAPALDWAGRSVDQLVPRTFRRMD